MPIDMNVFIQQANIVAKDTQFYVKNENITQQSTLTGLKKLFIFARRAENNSAAKSFLTALSNDNRYANYLAQVRAPLDALISAHKPLTAGVVRKTMQNLQLAEHLAKAVNAGMNFALDNKMVSSQSKSIRFSKPVMRLFHLEILSILSILKICLLLNNYKRFPIR